MFLHTNRERGVTYGPTPTWSVSSQCGACQELQKNHNDYPPPLQGDARFEIFGDFTRPRVCTQLVILRVPGVYHHV